MKITKAKYFLIPVAVCMLAIIGIAYYYFLSDFSQHQQTMYVYIDDDDDIDSVLVKLEPIAKTHAMTGFSTLARHTRYAEKVWTGRFAIEPGESTLNVLRTLKNGQQTAIMLTIPESRTMEKLAGTLAHKLMLDSAETAAMLTDNAFCMRYGYDTATVAALFVPNTYEVYWNVTLEHFMERMQREHDAFWKGTRTQKAAAINLTPTEVCTLASIIDEETANNDEKPMIAGMYLNRLREHMPLQADPTVKFAMKNFGLKRIYHDMLFFDSPYNTYRNEGLPPGPIKIASVKGIDAVLNHVSHDYLYMCAKEDFSGTHNFAVTYQEHLKNAAQYAKALNERGIK